MLSKTEWDALPYQVQQVWVLGTLGISPQAMKQPYLTDDKYVYKLIQKGVLSPRVIDHVTGEIRKRSRIKKPSNSKH